MGARAYGLFSWVLYGLSTTNEKIELSYLLNGSNNGHNTYLARVGGGKRPARGLRRKGRLVLCPPATLAFPKKTSNSR
jgi:hypothetical protein